MRCSRCGKDADRLTLCAEAPDDELLCAECADQFYPTPDHIAAPGTIPEYVEEALHISEQLSWCNPSCDTWRDSPCDCGRDNAQRNFRAALTRMAKEHAALREAWNATMQRAAREPTHDH